MALLPELRKLPDDVLSFPGAIDNVSDSRLSGVCNQLIAFQLLETRYTGVETDASAAIHAIKSDLTPALRR